MKPERVAYVCALLCCAALLAAPWRGHVDDFDAQIYTVVARNMARDGSWFDLRCLPSLRPVYREHLPFGLWPAAAAIRANAEWAIVPLYGLMTLGAIAVAVLLVGWLLFESGSSYTVHVTLDNASQLVTGDQVKVGGAPVGSVDRLELAPDGRARLTLSIDDSSLTPLHRGSRVEVRSVGLASIAGRYVALMPGPLNTAKIPDGGSIPGDNAQSEVDLDAVLNTLDPRALSDLQRLVHGFADASGGRAPAEFNAALYDLNPALSQTAAVAHEIARDQPRFERFLLESAAVVGAVASRRPELERLIPATGQTLSAIASQTASLDNSLRLFPPTLRQANTTLVNLRATLGDLRPAVREARPVAPLLNEFLVRLQPVARAGVSVIPALRRLIDRPGPYDLLGVLRGLPPLAQIAVPAFKSGLLTTKSALPIVDELRPYTPDLVGGQINGFGGTQSIYYDANGRYTRISFQGSGFTLNNAGVLVPAPTIGGLTGFQTKQVGRCPGASTQRVPDHSNPFIERPGFPCDPSQIPPG
jgi:phospholipid/cholesterol/gamma-HCH transport system substrate-binding protein